MACVIGSRCSLSSRHVAVFHGVSEGVRGTANNK
jgi:hypothetical protein